MRPGRKERLQVVVDPLDQALGLRVGRLADAAPSRPASRGTPGSRRSARCAAPRHRPTAPSPSQTSIRGTAPRLGQQPPPAGEQVLARRASGISSRGQPTGSSRTPSSAPAAASAVRVWPNPTGSVDVGEPEVALGDLARPHRSSATPGPAAGTPAAAPGPGRANTVIDAVPADPLGDHRGRHRRERLQQLPDPRLDLVHHRPRRSAQYLGGPSDGQRRLHRVPRDTPSPARSP